VAALAARGVYRWAAAGRYRAGLMTGAQATLLAILVTVAYQVTPRLKPATSPPPGDPLFHGWQDDVAAATQAPSGGAAERRLLAGVDALLEPPRDADDEIRACIQELSAEIAQVKRSIGYVFRFSNQDVHDVVHDALLNVCHAHVRKRYANLGAVLQRAAWRR